MDSNSESDEAEIEFFHRWIELISDPDSDAAAAMAERFAVCPAANIDVPQAEDIIKVSAYVVAATKSSILEALASGDGLHILSILDSTDSRPISLVWILHS